MFLKNMVVIGGRAFWATICSPDFAGHLQKKTEKSAKSGEQIVAQNRAASYNYHILEKHEAGLAHGTSQGPSRRESQYPDALVEFKPTSAWLVNAHIAQYLPGGP